jgi:uncharacterized membrane protein
MKEILVTFGSIVAILFGAILIYANFFTGTFYELGYIIGTFFGVIFLAAGITGLWMKGRLMPK